MHGAAHHQKLIEESPAPGLDPEERARTCEAAVRATRQIGYVWAGTMEFLLDHDGTLRFMEMNTRLQVEHCVTEMRTGVDLVCEQIRVAAGHRLSLVQEDIEFSGHVIECRINAENPDEEFRPYPGQITRWQSPHSESKSDTQADGGAGGAAATATEADVRVDTHVESGYEVPPFYDSLLCKVIARGADRDAACERMIAALDELVCEGVPTTAAMHQAILRSPEFRENRYDTRAIPGWPARD